MTYKKLILAMLLTTAAFPQNIVGTWQATLPTPQRELRLVMKLTRAADESLKATFFSIDQNGRGVTANITLKGTDFKAEIPAIGGNYEGKLSEDGTTIVGTFTQGAPIPLTFAKATTAAMEWAIPEPPPPPRQMPADAQPTFEVATIKPSNPDTPGRALNVGRGGGNSFSTLNMPLSELIRFAYGIHTKQVTGGPSWIEEEKYDILAKPDTPGMPNAPQVRSMVQKLLAERFGFQFHREKKELSTYLLSVDKSGLKLTKSESNGSNLPGFGGRGPGRIGVRNSSMPDFADFLQMRVLDRPVVDQTGLTDRYDFNLEFRQEGPGAAAAIAGGNPSALPQVADDRPELFVAVREQLGLKLETGKAQVEVIVIDKVTKPTAN
jgi:uncharacterized protein (TIGR03435 family)